MIYPVQDSYGNRIGTIIPEDSDNPGERWVAYAIHDQRKAFGSWQAARDWIEQRATSSDQK
ncbi:hypothetical protein [Brucella haematophila]|uniref:Uncharacterized protein n=1 Tax=Brucella haematophila TaxID=419474 RepID=A0ABX1DNF7_9HYPH|nr:hypothetical protein [Brucella haematophila]NKC04491.1 hypothetical protein [Brucella haematophila]TMV03862.1 hypothetical protein FGI60_07770 [Brucella haematophila]